MAEQTLTRALRPSRTRLILTIVAERGRRAARQAIAFGLFHALAIAAITAYGLHARDMAFGTRSYDVLATFTLGAALGGFLAWIAAAIITEERPVTARAAGMLVTLTVGTAGGILLIYFVEFTHVRGILQHERVHEMALSFLLSGLSVIYTFAASGARLLMPLGLIPLFAGTVAFAMLSRQR